MMTGTGSVTENSQFCLGEWGWVRARFVQAEMSTQGPVLVACVANVKGKGQKKEGCWGGGEKNRNGETGVLPLSQYPLFRCSASSLPFEQNEVIYLHSAADIRHDSISVFQSNRCLTRMCCSLLRHLSMNKALASLGKL